MKLEKRRLLWSIICMIIYVIFNVIYLTNSGGIISDNKIDSISNICIFSLSFAGIIYFLYLYIKDDDLNKHSKGILFFSIVFFVLNIISGVLGLMIYSKLDSRKKEKKRDLPIIELENYTNKWICLVFLIIALILMFPLSDKFNPILIYVFIFTSMVLLFRKQIMHDFKIFKEYFREYNSLVIKTWLKALVTLAILGISIQLITNTSNATNQQTLNNAFNKTPILIAILTMFYAPITEEIMFRGIFRKFINNKYLFIITSGIIFGALHVIDDFKTPIELLYILVYSSLGFYLANLYYKTNNICTNMYFHFLQNSLGVVGMIILKFLV